MSKKVNLTDSGKVNSFGYSMAACTLTYPEDDPTGNSYPITLDGDELDSYCNTIDTELKHLLDPLTDLAPNHPTGMAWNPESIPSPVQREAFMLMRTLMECANSLSGTLRYDVAVKHDDCKYHDDHARDQVKRIKAKLANL